MEQKIAIKIDDLTVAYNYKPVLWDIDLEIPEGVLMAIAVSYTHLRAHET